MSEQKVEQEKKPEKEDKHTKDWYVGYRAGYNKGHDTALAKAKSSSIAVEVKKEEPIKKQEIKQAEIVKPQQESSRIPVITAIIIAVVLGLVIWYVVSRRNSESSNQ